MDCPVCKVTLQMTEHQGVQIDYCSKCRGIWLEKGKLDMILQSERSKGDRYEHRRDRSEYHDDDHGEDLGASGRRRKRSLFDFFD